MAASNTQETNHPTIPYPHWKVWSTADALDHGGSSSLLVNDDDASSQTTDYDPESTTKTTTSTPTTQRRSYKALAHEASKILREWGHRWAGKKEFQSILNKNSLLHEIEESLVAIQSLLEWLVLLPPPPPPNNRVLEDEGTSSDTMDNEKSNSCKKRRRNDNGSDGITVIDLCSGKGIFSMLLSYMAARRCNTCSQLNRITRCVMIEKMTVRKGINWDHIQTTNEDVTKSTTTNSEMTEEEEGFFARIPIDIWDGCNIHDEGILSKLEAIPDKLAVVGIHLCKTLSPRCISLFNGLTPAKAPFLCLAPCCLPRIATCQKFHSNSASTSSSSDTNTGKASSSGNTILRINRYEPLEHRKQREKEKQMRNQALLGQGGRDKVCFICFNRTHRVRDCPLLPSDNEEARIQILKEAAKKSPCWRCGEVGHTRSECTSKQLKSRPCVRSVPSVDIDVSVLANTNTNGCGGGDDDAKGIFGLYCELIASAIQTPTEANQNVEIIQTSLVSDSSSLHGSNENNWNAKRKSRYIVTMR